MLTLWRKHQARRRGIPFQDPAFWPPYYINFGGKIAEGITVLTVIYSSEIGAIVPVMADERETHYYRLIGVSRASGDDHIASPLQFQIQYHHSEERRTP